MLQKVLLTIALLQSCYANDGVQDVRGKIPVSSVFFNCLSLIPDLEDNKFSHTTCEFNTFSSSKSGVINSGATCNITVGSWPLPKVTTENTCRNIKFDENNSSGELLPIYEALTIDEDKVMLLFYADELVSVDNIIFQRSTKISVFLQIINIKSCTTTKIHFSSVEAHNGHTLFLSTPILHKDKFEIAVGSETECAGLEKCWLKYDYEGRRINNPEPYPSNVTGYMRRLADNEYYVSYRDFELDESFEKITYIDRMGRTTNGVSSSLFSHEIIEISDAHGLYSICKLPVSQNHSHDLFESTRLISCTQFAGAKITMNVTLELPGDVNWMNVRSLPKGGFLLSTMNCKAEGKETVPHCRELKVWRVRKDGSVLRSVEIRGFDFECKNHYNIYPGNPEKIWEDHQDFCFHSWCVVKGKKWNSKNLQYHKSCIPKKYLYSTVDIK